MAEALADVGIAAVPQLCIWHYTVDFAIPDEMIVIECDGDYWHSLAECMKRDKRKDAYLSSLGWRIYRFSETAIKSDIHACVQTIQQAVGSQCRVSSIHDCEATGCE